MPQAMKGQAIPGFADGGKIPGVVFEGEFTFGRDSAHGPLLFRAVVTSKQWEWSRQGQFRRNAQGAIETLLIEGLTVIGARDLTVSKLPPEVARQSANGTTAFAIYGDKGWTIFRWRHGVMRPMVQEGQTVVNGRRLRKLNARPLVSPKNEIVWDEPNAPIFALNDAGDVAFFASDGQSWGVYEFSDRR